MKQLQPKHWSALRIWAGTQVYTLAKSHLPYLIHTHHTPLYRRLRDIDMEMQWNKVINLNIAIKQLSNTIIYQDEVLSYWKSIGRPSKRKGYVDGMVLIMEKWPPVSAEAYVNFQIWFIGLHYTVPSPSPNAIDIVTMCSRTQNAINHSEAALPVRTIISTCKSRIKRTTLISYFYI